MGTARPLEGCAALLLSLFQPLLNSSEPGDFLFHLSDSVRPRRPRIRAIGWSKHSDKVLIRTSQSIPTYPSTAFPGSSDITMLVVATGFVSGSTVY
jgi:hypothetical protein